MSGTEQKSDSAGYEEPKGRQHIPMQLKGAWAERQEHISKEPPSAKTTPTPYTSGRETTIKTSQTTESTTLPSTSVTAGSEGTGALKDKSEIGPAVTPRQRIPAHQPQQERLGEGRKVSQTEPVYQLFPNGYGGSYIDYKRTSTPSDDKEKTVGNKKHESYVSVPAAPTTQPSPSATATSLGTRAIKHKSELGPAVTPNQRIPAHQPQQERLGEGREVSQDGPVYQLFPNGYGGSYIDYKRTSTPSDDKEKTVSNKKHESYVSVPAAPTTLPSTSTTATSLGTRAIKHKSELGPAVTPSQRIPARQHQHERLGEGHKVSQDKPAHQLYPNDHDCPSATTTLPSTSATATSLGTRALKIESEPEEAVTPRQRIPAPQLQQEQTVTGGIMQASAGISNSVGYQEPKGRPYVPMQLKGAWGKKEDSLSKKGNGPSAINTSPTPSPSGTGTMIKTPQTTESTTMTSTSAAEKSPKMPCTTTAATTTAATTTASATTSIASYQM